MYCIFAYDSCIFNKGRILSEALARYNNKKTTSLILESFCEVKEEKLKDIQFKENELSLYDFISDGIDNKKYSFFLAIDK
ncbi:3568_t:CDS:2 [Funneliformis mosseae]|uniref:3568_t:CDS:1 n=1 Tax=Funneliformis mosseae TaxID=27381 RepID=A0A9N9GB62_FUNMO|nr:3568_t:CDS:2 [Funneliformis mosseae]